MTDDSLSAGQELGRIFGRIEKQLDGIDAKLDGHAEKITEHGVRLNRAEKDIEGIKQTAVGAETHRVTGRQVVYAAMAGALSTGAITWAVNFFTQHH